jgi:hypothetical protein
MSVTSYGRSFTLAAANDERTGHLRLTSITLVGTGMTAGQRLTITQSDGEPIADHYVEAANENKELLINKKQVLGVKLTAIPAGGTKTVTVTFD